MVATYARQVGAEVDRQDAVRAGDGHDALLRQGETLGVHHLRLLEREAAPMEEQHRAAGLADAVRWLEDVRVERAVATGQAAAVLDDLARGEALPDLLDHRRPST